MAYISYNATQKIDLDRKLEIIERTSKIKIILTNYYYDYQYWNYGINAKLDKALSFYKKEYKEDLDENEKSIFYLYIIFPDDNKFMKLIEQYDNNFEKIGHIYGTTEKIAILRYRVIKSIQKEKQNIQRLTLKNHQNI